MGRTAPHLPFFVIFGTGRSGSTLLSDILDLHPDVLSISEFIIGLLAAGLQHRDQKISATDFCHILHSANPSRAILVRIGIKLPETRYPFSRNGMRYTENDPVPFPLYSMLPRLTNDPDALFCDILDHVRLQDGKTAGQHLNAVFQALKLSCAGKVIVERSGGTLAFHARVRDLLPHARPIVHLRDGTETALSMRNHSFFKHFVLRMVMQSQLGYDPYYSRERTGIAQLDQQLIDNLPENITAAHFERLELPLRVYGELWSNAIRLGVPLLSQTLPWFDFKELCTEPERFLRLLSAQLGVSPWPEWIEKSEQLIAPPRDAVTHLSEMDRMELRDACRPGSMLLADLKGT